MPLSRAVELEQNQGYTFPLLCLILDLGALLSSFFESMWLKAKACFPSKVTLIEQDEQGLMIHFSPLDNSSTQEKPKIFLLSSWSGSSGIQPLCWSLLSSN